jgi:putative ABC transport system ATP-binding protein
MLSLTKVCKSYFVGNDKVDILSDFSMKINAGERIAITGPSGSGKSTLLNLMSTMDVCDSGEIYFKDVNISRCPQKISSRLRLSHFGFVFQSYHLIKTLTLFDNIVLPLAAAKKEIDKKTVVSFATDLGLGDRLSHYPHQLSGGEQQRVAVARALINNPEIVFADEPTGNLDKWRCCRQPAFQ